MFVMVSTGARIRLVPLPMQNQCGFPVSLPIGYVCVCFFIACAITCDSFCRYCICTTSSDDLAEAEFMMFDRVARMLVGKPIISLLRLRYPGFTSVKNLSQMGGGDVPLPPEVKRIVGQKFKLVAGISKKSFSAANSMLSFQVVRIVDTYKPELQPIGSGPGSVNDGCHLLRRPRLYRMMLNGKGPPIDAQSSDVQVHSMVFASSCSFVCMSIHPFSFVIQCRCSLLPCGRRFERTHRQGISLQRLFVYLPS